jgi:hypothetical protein
MSLFDTKGELNAVSQQEALSALVRVAKILEQGLPAGQTQAGRPGVNDAARDELVRQALLDQNGKVALAQAMALPIRRNLDYQGVGRRALVVDELGTGVLPIYERDIDVAAFVVSANGAVPESIVRGDRVFVPEFEIMSNPVVRIREVRQRRFNVIERAIQKAKQEIAANEDANLFASLDFAGDDTLGGENAAVALGANMTRRDLVEIKTAVDRWDLFTSKYFMNIVDYQDLLMWTQDGGTAAADVDPVTTREILQTGLYGKIFGADIIVTKVCPVGTVFGCADPEFVGVMPIRQNVEVLPADEPKRASIGWVALEVVGTAISNARGVVAGRK